MIDEFAEKLLFKISFSKKQVSFLRFLMISYLKVICLNTLLVFLQCKSQNVHEKQVILKKLCDNAVLY